MSNSPELLIILALFVVFIFVSNRRRKNASKQLSDSVKVGAQVIMLGGIKGKITAINEDTVIVETTPGNRIEFVKAAVRNVSAPSLDTPAKAVPKAKATAAKASVAAAKPKSPTTKKTAK